MITANTTFYRTQRTNYDTYKTFDFETIASALNKHYLYSNNSFISYVDNKWHVVFEAKTGLQHLSGCDLIKYPALAQALQKVDNYPVLVKKYPLNISQNLILHHALKNFADEIEKYQLDFETQKSTIDATVNNYLFLFGQNKTIPLYQDATAFIEHRNSGCHYTKYIKIIISGASYLLQNNTNYPKPTGLKDCKMLFLVDIAKPELLPYSLEFTGGIKETPYLSVHVKTSWKNKGHEKWLDMVNNCVIRRKDVFSNAQEIYKVNPEKNFELLKTVTINTDDQH